MADNFKRRLYILEMLKRKEDGVITIPEIIRRLSGKGFENIRNRTIERDLAQLSTEFAIGCDNSVRPFQWWWAGLESYDIPGMGRNSALSFKLSQQYLEPLLPHKSLKHLQPKFRQAKKVLSGKGKEKDRRWVNKIRVVSKALAQIQAVVSESVHDAVYEALYEEKMLQIDYLSRDDDELSQRRIHPLALIYRGITSELIICEDGQIKRFILNRIKKAKVQIQSVLIPEGFNLDHYIDENLGFPGSCELIEFKAWIDASVRQDIEETPLTKEQTIEEAGDGHIILTATLRETASLTAWILGMNEQIIVLEPEALKDKIIDLITGMVKNYQ
ncbi:helix-turn-helix transcriptional regulator [sulfur-oxidizing endosymbiont of Gigantopelta aegis]|uniref:helix-turn-helix transcriptional regulator n=1 Tax=sulfur-oxidizing endosymbiont of Gigantopelta aegis TaxID=2794934 RepID=UPI0018DAFDEE|nr:WYL domain-containing protein [sulfur-oxidizing endosymbiont of Gigantopelta aegis]